ncbi:TonB-dependent siderophore receptor [Nostoc sp. CALU 1950]|uniref:TonB-dependent siderophore receptor n=1 Tax=Nostoc sp. CALU 1950 TaxID=3104321 RepID=UPI003EBA81A3
MSNYCWLKVWMLGSILGLIALPAGAEASFTNSDPNTSPVATTAKSNQKIPRLNEIERPATTVNQWLAQGIIQVTGVKLRPTDKELEVILENTGSDKLQPVIKSEGNNFIADIPNAQLNLASGSEFRQENPATGITVVTVTNIDANTIRITVTGEASSPTVELFDSNEGLIFGVVVTETPTALQPPTTEQPTSETQPETPTVEQDEPIELVVTGEQDGYRVTNTTTGTRTDTPLRDIPQSIQIVPQQVLRDQQINRLDDALRNVAGVIPEFNAGPAVYYKIRGFGVSDNSLLRDGLPDPGVGDSVELANVEQIEVVKGPASVLFGLGSPGGSINIVTKRPLRDPFYAVDATVGSYSFYRGAVDLSGPLNDSKTVLYRLNTAYRNSGSFIDSYSSESLSLSPVISVAIGERTNLTLSADYIETRDSGKGFGVPTIGTIFPNPNGKIPRNRNLTEPTDNVDGTTVRAGYQLEHKFNDNWSLTNAFRYGFRSLYSTETRPDILDADNRTISRSFSIYENEFTSFTLTTNVVGKFSTGSIQHQLLFGVDLNRSIGAVPRTASGDAAPIDIFNPIYGQPSSGLFTFEARNEATTDSFGIYLQDQITLIENLKLLLGARFDGFRQNSQDFIANTESSQSNSALSPRFGIVYQPIPPVSLYASYISSFTPARGTFLFGANLDTLFEPERGRQFEVGVKADLNDRLSATLALYDLTRTNVLVTDPNNQDFQIQTGEQNSRGVELSLSGEILPGWNISAGYAYTDARITKDTTFDVGSRLESVPDHSFNLWTTYEIQKGDLQGLGFGLGLFFVGDRPGNLQNTYDIPSYLRTDAAIFYKRDRLKVGLNFNNLFDVDYFEIGYFGGRVGYGQPFTVQGTVSWQF